MLFHQKFDNFLRNSMDFDTLIICTIHEIFLQAHIWFVDTALWGAKKGVPPKKTRAQYVKIWPRYKGFTSKKIHFQKISFVCPANEKRRKSAGFQDFSEFFFLHGQLSPPYSTRGLTLIEGGIKKPEKGKI